MLRRELLEKEIYELKSKANELGFDLIELRTQNKKIIKELEYRRKYNFMAVSPKPLFVSPVNYVVRLEEGEYGRIYGIKITGRSGVDSTIKLGILQRVKRFFSRR